MNLCSRLVAAGLLLSVACGTAFAQFEKDYDNKSDDQPMGQVMETQWNPNAQPDEEVQKQKEWGTYQQKETRPPAGTGYDPAVEQQKLREMQDYNAKMQYANPPAYSPEGQIPPVVSQPAYPALPQRGINTPQSGFYGNPPPASNPPIMNTGVPITLETRLRWLEQQVSGLQEQLQAVNDRVAALQAQCQHCCVATYSRYVTSLVRVVSERVNVRPGESYITHITPLDAIENVEVASRSTVVVMSTVNVVSQNPYEMDFNIYLSRYSQLPNGRLTADAPLKKGTVRLSDAGGNKNYPTTHAHAFEGIEPGKYQIKRVAEPFTVVNVPGAVSNARQALPMPDALWTGPFIVLVIPEKTAP